MKVPPDVRHLKEASVVLTKLVPDDLPQGILCNIQQTVREVNGVDTAKPDGRLSSVGGISEDTNSSGAHSCTTYSEEGSHHVPPQTILYSTKDQQSNTESLGSLPITSTNTERKTAPPKRDFKHESTTTCATDLPYIASPRKRRKLNFPSQILVNADIKECNITSNANDQASTSTDQQTGTKVSIDMPTLAEMRCGNSANEPGRSIILAARKKISNTVLGKTQHCYNTFKQNSSKEESHFSHTERGSKILHVKSFEDKAVEKQGNYSSNKDEQSPKSKACEVNDASMKKPSSTQSDTVDFSNKPISSIKSKTKIENITAKLMREKQKAGKFTSTLSTSIQISPFSSKIKRENSGTTEYTSIMPINKRQFPDQKGQRARKRPVKKQYVRANSAIDVSLKKELITKQRCSSEHSSSGNKLNETRQMLKTAISASAVNTKFEHTPPEDWLQGMQKNVPNILVKSKFVLTSKGSTKTEPTATCFKSTKTDKIRKASSETASAELCRLEKIQGTGNPKNLTKIKPKRNRKKQGNSLTEELVQPGPSGYRKISGVAVEGKALTETQNKTVLTSDTGRISPTKGRKSDAVHIKNPNAFPLMKDLNLPVKGSKMAIIKTSPQKGNRVSLTYKNKIGSGSPISFNFSSKTRTDIPGDTTEVARPKSLPSKSTTAVKPVVQMGSFAISKSQEIIPIKSNESFLTQNTKQNAITPKRVSHAISYADYCARMDDVEASKDVEKNKQRRKSESDVVKKPEVQKIDADTRNILKDQLREDANSLLKKLNQLHVNTTKCSEDAMSAQSSENFNVTYCSEVGSKEEKDENAIKVDIDDDDDDTESVHLSDHRYTKTPDASPAKSLTKDILHQTSTKSGTVALVKRKRTPEEDRKQPVYAVKYGNKLFLIHNKDEKKNEEVKTDTKNIVKQASNLKAISPKIEIKTGKEQTPRDSPYSAKTKGNRKVNAGKLVSKRKLDFIKQLVLNQKYLKRKKKQEKQSIYSCRSNRVSVQRNAKVVYITRPHDIIQATTLRVGITLTKGTDAELKRWSRYADFKALFTYHQENNTLIHIKVDELQPGFYKITPVSDIYDERTETVILTSLPPHPDAIIEGDIFIAVGPFRNVVDTGNDAKHTAEWSSSEFYKNLGSILPSTAMCHGGLYSSDVSYRPKVDAQEWYGAGVFDIFTRKYCRQKRVVQRRKWDKNPYDKAFH